MQRHNHRLRGNQKKRTKDRKASKKPASPGQQMLDMSNQLASQTDPRFGGTTHKSFT